MIATFLTRRRGVLEQGFWRQDAPDMDRSVLSEDAIDKLPDSPFAGSRLSFAVERPIFYKSCTISARNQVRRSV